MSSQLRQTKGTTWVLVGLLQGATALMATHVDAAPPPLQPAPIAPPRVPISNIPLVSNITASLTPISATLSWPATSGATGYLVARAIGAPKPLPISTQYTSLTPSPISQTTFTEVDLTPNTTYSWVVTAVFPDGHQVSGVPGVFTTPVPTNPGGFTATAEIGGFVTLSWQPVVGATSYLVTGGATGGRPVPPTMTQLVDYAMFLPAGTAVYDVYANFQGPAGSFMDQVHKSETSVALRGAAAHVVPWLTFSDPINPDPDGGLHAAEAGQYLTTIGALPNKSTLAQWMQANGYPVIMTLASPAATVPCRTVTCLPTSSMSSITNSAMSAGPANSTGPVASNPGSTQLRAVYFNAGDLNLGRDMRCTQNGQNIACMVSNFAPAANFFAADSTDVQTALAGAVQGAHIVANGYRYLATVAMEVSLAQPDSVRFYVYAAPNDAISKAAVLDTETNQVSDVPGGFSPFNCITCHGGTYDTASHTVKGAAFLPFDAYSFKYSSQPGFRQADQEETLRQLNALVKATRANSPAGAADPIASFIDGMYAGNVGVTGAKANDTWVPPGWSAPYPAAPNLYNAVVKPLCRTCHLAISLARADLAFASYAQFVEPSYDLAGHPTGGLRDSIRQRLCRGDMPQAEVPFRKFWQNPNISWMGYLQLTIAGWPPC